MATEERCVGNYILGDTLGKGGYSWVKKGTDKDSKKVVALKFMARADSSWEREQAQQVRTEIKSMIKISNPHVMKLYAYNLNAQYPEKDNTKLSTILLVLEFCPGGELFDILYYTHQLKEKPARTYFRQMVLGIEACHAAGIVHRDIKPQNLLLNIDFQLKITDFGLSHLFKDKLKQDETMKTFYVGTRGYQAPELLIRKKFTKACDVFSMGVVLFILLTGYPPFDQAQKNDKWYRPLYKKDEEAFWAMHKGCGVSKECRSLITGMLCYDQKHRFTIDQVKAHPWFNAEILSPKDLKYEMLKLHKAARKKRANDKTKMKDMEVSVKKRDFADDMEKVKKAWGLPALGENQALTSFVTPATGDALLTFFTIKEILEKVLFQGKLEIEPLDESSPYLLVCGLNIGSTTSSDVGKAWFQLSVVKDGDKYVFNFTRRNSSVSWLKYKQLFTQIEYAMLASGMFEVEDLNEDEKTEEQDNEQSINGTLNAKIEPTSNTENTEQVTTSG